MRRLIIALVPVVLAACGGSDSPSTSSTPSVTVAVSSQAVGGDDLGAWLTATVAVTAGDVDGKVPTVIGIRCSGGDTIGEYQAQSTLELAAPVPAGTTVTGDLNLLVPGDTRTGAPVPTCTAPAVIVAGEQTFPIDDQVLAQLAGG